MAKILDQPVDRYPLAWPVGWPITPKHLRKRAQFHTTSKVWRGDASTGYNQIVKRDLTMASAVERLMRECDRLGAQGAVLSTNIALRLDGQPRSDQRTPDEPGVALYFRHKGTPIVMACDKWDRVPDNVAAIAGHIEALRATDRYGVGRLEQALAGYQRLLSGRRSWYAVLGFTTPPVEWERIEERYKTLAKTHHPDVAGGDTTRMAEITAAYATARLEFGR